MKDILGRWGKMKQGLRQTLLPPQVAVVLVPALIEAVVHNPVPWSYHGNAFCYKGLSDFGEHQSCSPASETAGSENLRLGLGGTFGNRGKEDRKMQDVIVQWRVNLFLRKSHPYFIFEEYQTAISAFFYMTAFKVRFFFFGGCFVISEWNGINQWKSLKWWQLEKICRSDYRAGRTSLSICPLPATCNSVMAEVQRVWDF